MTISKQIIVALLASVLSLSVNADNKEDKQADTSLKEERNLIRKGNKLFESKRYGEAEVEYKKALQVNPMSEIGNYNLAAALLQQGGGVKANDKEDKNNPINQAQGILSNLVKTSSDRRLVGNAYYNLGNIDFAREQYQQAIDNYKNCLRRNPDDDKARQNLRLAQKKLQEQQNQDKNQDQQQQQQQQNQDQNKEKNHNQQNQQSEQQKSNDKNEQKNQGGMSQENIDQILKTMQNQENAVQQKVNAQKAKEQRASGRRTGNQW